jgi:glycerol-3-phosphate cytidylyltransferase-like family protein
MRGCRWIDLVVEDVPYVTQLDVVDKYHVGEWTRDYRRHWVDM